MNIKKSHLKLVSSNGQPINKILPTSKDFQKTDLKQLDNYTITDFKTAIKKIKDLIKK